MEYRLGTSKKIKSKGETINLICPCCNENVQFGVFSNLERRLAPKITLFDLNTVYFLVCPNCASVFSIDEEKGDEIKRGNDLQISADDLKQLKEFKAEI